MRNSGVVALLALAALLAIGRGLRAGEVLPADVVLSELGWTDDGGFVELANTSDARVALEGWRLEGDVHHAFDTNATIEAHGFLVLRSPADATAPIASPTWSGGHLRAHGTTISLRDPAGRVADRVAGARARASDSWQRLLGTSTWRHATPTPGCAPRGKAPSVFLDGARCEPMIVRSDQAVSVAVRATFRGPAPLVVKARWTAARSSGETVLAPAETDGEGRWFRGAIAPVPDQSIVRVTVAVEGDVGVTTATTDDGQPLEFLRFDGVETKLPVYCFDVPRLGTLLARPERERFAARLAIVEEGRVTFRGDVTVQVRGGTWTRAWVKRNWVVNFPARPHEDEPRQVNLRSGWHDPTALRDVLSLQLYREAGVPASLARHVRVQLDGEPAGLFAEVEMVDARFLARNGLPRAALYQAVVAKHQSGPQRCDGRTYSSRSGYEAHWSKRTRQDEPYDDLVAFVEGFHACETPEQLRAFFAEHLDVERYASYLAVNELVTHWDSAVKNFYWCRDVRSGRWVVIPWDLDRTWGDHFEGFGYADATLLSGTHDEPIDRGGRDWWNWLQDRFLAVPEFRRLVLLKVVDLTLAFPATRLEPEIDRRVAELRREILLDRARWGGFKRVSKAGVETYEPGPFTESDLARGVEQLRTYVRARLTTLRRRATTELSRLGGAPPSPDPPREQPRAAAPPASPTWVLALPVAALLYLLAGYGSDRERP